eukprot:10344545-Alexandrium_andersonii.AAC.1
MDNCEALGTCAVTIEPTLTPIPSAFASSRGAWPLVVHDARDAYAMQEGSQVSPRPSFREE